MTPPSPSPQSGPCGSWLQAESVSCLGLGILGLLQPMPPGCSPEARDQLARVRGLGGWSTAP